MTSRRAFRPCLDALPARIAPTNYPPIDVSVDPMGGSSAGVQQTVPLIVLPGSPEDNSSLIQGQLQINAALSS